jgi:hypothetical protein
MTSKTISYDLPAGSVDAFETAREFVAVCVIKQGRSQKSIAYDMDTTPSQLSRKLAQNPGDSARFTLDDFEKFVEVTGDTSPIFYLLEKYCTKRTDRIAELERELERLKAQQVRAV